MVLLPVAVVYAIAGRADEGITLPLTRVIYPESEASGITFTVTNNTDHVYLLQSRVLPAKDDESGVQAPFIVVPPLTRFEPGTAVTLLIRQTDRPVVVDKESQESLWRLALKTIPAQQNTEDLQTGDKQLVLALQNNLKLFYRPSVITELTENERAEQLQFALNDSQMTVVNPTPYYITFSELVVDGLPVKIESDRMIAPYSTMGYSVKPTASEVSWMLIGDDGRQTIRLQRLLR
ncbi:MULTISPECIES: fimbrial biogenesis chaperone [Providencia]|uniref:fimbrial biogenesis chaperone n=1 Tax=Providencia TaxID=586 RepID=UPI0018A7B782|nr:MULTISPECIES: molecular chaperone [Providencia]